MQTKKYDTTLKVLANKKRKRYYENDVYIRGLIEFTNFCKNNCFYCGIRKGNKCVERYRLKEREILTSCKQGYELGARTFVLQGGEDDFFTDDIICSIVKKIKTNFKDCAITLSLGEKTKKSYKKFFKAGATRYLLRQETACKEHYKTLHPKEMSFENRINCLINLKKIGFQVGAGFLVGSPFQTIDNIVKDLRFLQYLKPDMVGIGPFIPHKDTPFGSLKNIYDINLTIKILAIVRLMLPYSLIPVTTAILSLKRGLLQNCLYCGANVIMLNVTSQKYKKYYALYNNKLNVSLKTLKNLKDYLYNLGYTYKISKGDAINIKRSDFKNY